MSFSNDIVVEFIPDKCAKEMDMEDLILSGVRCCHGYKNKNKA